MGKLSNFFGKLPFLSGLGGKKKSNKSNVELQYEKALNQMENGNHEEAVENLERIVDIAIVDPQYKQFGIDALKIMGQLYETGKYSNCLVDVDMNKACKYYEKLVNLNKDGEMIYKLAKMLLDIQNFSKAITYFEKATECGIKAAYMNLGSIYENGLNRIDQYGNKSDFVVPVDYEKAMRWYKRLADMGDTKAKSAYDRVEYASQHTDSIEFEEKDKLYTQIAESRREKGKEPRYKAIEASRLQYQYTYVHNQVDGYIHKLPKGWVKTINEETDEEYYAPSLTYKDFAMYVSYDSIPRDSKKTLENYLRYCNDAFEEELQLKAYITDYADGICTTFYHKEMEKGIVTFAFYQGKRLACMKFICATMDIIEQYEEIIFETANSFAFVDPTMVSDQSLNRKENQYYSEAVYCYYLEDYEGAMAAAKQALKLGSIKASYLLIELYFDEDSPYKDIEKTISYAKQLFDATKDPDLAFLLGNIHDQQLKDYMKALNWYENAHRLGHKRVAFYLGRLYYSGALRSKRDGVKALQYFKEAAANGILEAEAYIKDIEELGGEDLQSSVEKWERAVEAGSGASALKIALYKQSQVFYMANSYEIEKAFNEALGLGSYQAAYELAKIYQQQENDENYHGEIRSVKYFERAYDNGYDGFDKENLFKIIEYKAEKLENDSEKIPLYLQSAKMGHVPAIDVLINIVPSTTDEIRALYDELIGIAETGDDSAIICMHKLELKFNDLVIMEPDEGEKIIENKFFRLCVPKECTASINDEGGTIKFADSVVEFAVAELPVSADNEEGYLKIYKLILSEYLPDENAEIIIANSRMIGSGMIYTKNNVHTYSVLLISSKNQYMFKLSSRDKREMMTFKDNVTKIARSLVETGEIYVATEDAKKNIGLSVLLRSNENGFLSIGKMD
ncbi:MAG: sel1 repeat family protein [Lachnospiraceae bacterium]|nr:sel1 repeat family protein [Lachnospiraceae bacterium]